MMVSERILAPLPVFPELPVLAELVTVMRALELTGPLYAWPLAVIVVVPAPIPRTSPEALTVATEGTVELHVTELVMFCVDGWLALPNVPVAVSCEALAYGQSATGWCYGYEIEPLGVAATGK